MQCVCPFETTLLFVWASTVSESPLCMALQTAMQVNNPDRRRIVLQGTLPVSQVSQATLACASMSAPIPPGKTPCHVTILRLASIGTPKIG